MTTATAEAPATKSKREGSPTAPTKEGGAPEGTPSNAKVPPAPEAWDGKGKEADGTPPEGKRKGGLVVLPKNIHEAKLRVMEEVTYIKKRQPDKESRGVKYSYGAEADYIHHLRPVMIKWGLVVAPIDCLAVSKDPYPTKSGDSFMQHHVVRVTYRLTHAPSGTYEDVVVEGEASDVGDKSVPKALTQALKAFLRQAFLIETGDDDPDSFDSAQYEQGNLESGPTGSSFKRLKKAIQDAKSAAEVHSLLGHARHVPTRKYNFSPAQTSELNRVALIVLQEIFVPDKASSN